MHGKTGLHGMLVIREYRMDHPLRHILHRTAIFQTACLVCEAAVSLYCLIKLAIALLNDCDVFSVPSIPQPNLLLPCAQLNLRLKSKQEARQNPSRW